jgi:hypothetical protein
LITGQGPDIVVSGAWSIAQMNPVFFADIYTFIDEDPEINREDFFPNALGIFETGEGTLPFISNGFDIRTMIVTQETAENISPFTFESILHLLNDPTSPEVFGAWWFDFYFITFALENSDNEFIDMDENTANLDSAEFINVLKIAENMRSLGFDGSVSGVIDEQLNFAKMHSGELLLVDTFAFSIEGHLFRLALGDSVAIGLPSPTGGVHRIRPMQSNLAINATSENGEAAWSFVRRFLLPGYSLANYVPWMWPGLPLRIDTLEMQLEEYMIPNIVDGAEQPIFTWGGDELPVVSVYSMTEPQAAEFLEIVKSARAGTIFSRTIMDIINEDVGTFLFGGRTAEDTARIMQSRVQLYLWERG